MYHLSVVIIIVVVVAAAAVVVVVAAAVALAVVAAAAAAAVVVTGIEGAVNTCAVFLQTSFIKGTKISCCVSSHSQRPLLESVAVTAINVPKRLVVAR